MTQRGYDVILTAKTLDQAEAAAQALRQEAAEGAQVEALELDVTNEQHVERLLPWVTSRFGRLDTLVNNAGLVDEQGPPSISQTDMASMRHALENNTLGAMRTTQALLPLLLEGGGGNVVMVSSGMGGLNEMGSNHAAYRVSKAALNALTRIFHSEFSPAGLRVNSVCPGFVRTELSAANRHAPLDVADGARGIVWAATLDARGPSGGFFRHGQMIPW